MPKGLSACSLPEGLFIDAKPLVQVLNRTRSGEAYSGSFHAGGRICFANEPTGHKVEERAGRVRVREQDSNV